MAVPGGRQYDAVPEPHRRRRLGEGAEHHFGRRTVRELLEEVVLRQPDVFEPHLLGEPDLLDDLPEDLGLLAGLPWPGDADLIEQAEVHSVSLLMARSRETTRSPVSPR